MAIDASTYPAPHPQVAARTVDDQAVIVLADTGEVTVLNGVGTRIWELADGAHSVAAISEVIASEYGIGASRARQDLEEFLIELVAAQAIVLNNQPVVT
jgi:hypothetical protein